MAARELLRFAAIRCDLRQTLDVAGACRLEITQHDEPDRLARWMRIAREEIARTAVVV